MSSICGSTIGGSGRPVMTTPRHAASEKSTPSLSLPRQTASSSAWQRAPADGGPSVVDRLKKLKTLVVEPRDAANFGETCKEAHAMWLERVRQQNLQWLKENMRLTVIENCGHVCSIEAPELFNDLVLKFLTDQEVPGAVTATPVPMKWSELKALQKG